MDGSEDYRSPRLQRAVGTHFDSMTTNGQILDYVVEHPGWAGWLAGRDARKIADTQKLILHLHPGFYPRNMPDRLRNAESAEIISYMDQRISHLLELVRKVDDGFRPTYLNFVNEAIWDNSWQGKPDEVGWYDDQNRENPLYRLFGTKWLSEVYARIYRQAEVQKFHIGKDLFLIYNDAHISSPGRKAQFLLGILSSVKKEVSQVLGILIEQVQLDVGMQLHLSMTPQTSSPGTYILPPTDDELVAAMKLFSGIGRVHLTEFDVKGGGQQERVKTFERICQAAIRSGYCASITFWDTFRFNGDLASNFDYGPNGLFDTIYNTTDSYDQLIGTLVALV